MSLGHEKTVGLRLGGTRAKVMGGPPACCATLDWNGETTRGRQWKEAWGEEFGAMLVTYSGGHMGGTWGRGVC